MDLKGKFHEMLHNVYGPDTGDTQRSSHQRGHWNHRADYQGGKIFHRKSFNRLWVGCTKPSTRCSSSYSHFICILNWESDILGREAISPTPLMNWFGLICVNELMHGKFLQEWQVPPKHYISPRHYYSLPVWHFLPPLASLLQKHQIIVVKSSHWAILPVWKA